MTPQPLRLALRSQLLERDEGGHYVWRVHLRTVEWSPPETALLLCDVWDNHWCRGAVERLEAMVPRMNNLVTRLRARGVRIIHAPSGTMSFYEGAPARERLRTAPAIARPAPLDHDDPPLPVDASDHGCDTADSPARPWTRQHAGIAIDQARDGISDVGEEVYRFLRAEGLEHLLIMGVHANMCVLGRSFAIKQMVRWGVEVVLVRDLTDAMYNPARPPYVSHAEGTRLVVEYIEKHWCPTVASGELVGRLSVAASSS